MSDLPKSWSEVPLANLSNKIGSGSTPTGGKTAYKEAGVPLIRSMNIHFSGFTDKGLAYLDEGQARKLDSVTVLPGDVLLNITGASIGRVTIAPTRMNGARVNQHVAIIRLADGLESAFVSGYLSSPQMQRIIGQENYGVTRQALTKYMIEGFRIPTPPLPEQRRIVAKIDSVSAKSRRARHHLDHIPRLVEKYKQAILAAAFRGDLTQAWRKTTASGAPSLVPLSKMCVSITDGDHQAPPRAETGVPFITISAMNDGKIDLRKATRFVPRSYFDSLKPARRPSGGDVLYSVTGSFGIPALVDFDQPFVFQRHIAILKPDNRKVDVAFLFRLLAAPQMLDQARSVATGTAQLTVPLSGLREFLLPFPALDEQREVVRVIENAFAWIDRLASETTNARKLIDHLDQTILAKAFRGQLVPQDPNDEPASVLLERIRAERLSNARTPKERKKRTLAGPTPSSSRERKSTASSKSSVPKRRARKR
ncbi:type I restriction enzyme S subunit [Nitrobacteraceae bacterium AZCC 2161]